LELCDERGRSHLSGGECCSVAMYYSVVRRDAARSQHVCLVRI